MRRRAGSPPPVPIPRPSPGPAGGGCEGTRGTLGEAGRTVRASGGRGQAVPSGPVAALTLALAVRTEEAVADVGRDAEPEAAGSTGTGEGSLSPRNCARLERATWAAAICSVEAPAAVPRACTSSSASMASTSSALMASKFSRRFISTRSWAVARVAFARALKMPAPAWAAAAAATCRYAVRASTSTRHSTRRLSSWERTAVKVGWV